jgi:hypothetical protein
VTAEEWEERVAAAWARIDHTTPGAFSAEIASLVSELPDGHPVGLPRHLPRYRRSVTHYARELRGPTRD